MQLSISSRTQSQAAIINAIQASGTIGIHSLASGSPMHVNEVLGICDQLERRGVVRKGVKGRKQTYTLVKG
jgi:predicted transcriptional regulator